MDNNTPGQNNPNPYAPPSANVDEENQALENAASFIPEGRKIPARTAGDIYGVAWDAFKRQPWNWIACALIFGLLSVLTACIPIGGQILGALLFGGILITCARFWETGVVEIGDIFAGFQLHGSQLAIFGLIQAGFFYLIHGPFQLAELVLTYMTGFEHSHAYSPILIVTVKGLSAVTGAIGGIIVGLSNFAGPALIVFHNIKPFDAFKTSFSVWFKNWTFGLLFGFYGLLIGICGVLACCLGSLVAAPVCLIASFLAYRAIFLANNRQSF